MWPSKLLQQTLLNASFNFIIWFLFDIKGFKKGGGIISGGGEKG